MCSFPDSIVILLSCGTHEIRGVGNVTNWPFIYLQLIILIIFEPSPNPFVFCMRPDTGCASPNNQFLFCSIITHVLYKLINQMKSRGNYWYKKGMHQQNGSILVPVFKEDTSRENSLR